MVTTRRQSGRISLPIYTNQDVDLHGESIDDDDSNAYVDYNEEDSDSGSDWERITNPRMSDQPVQKRLKLKDANIVSRSKGKKVQKGRDLRLLLNLPLDVLFEIFSFLSPGDLLNLIRTNKSFRATLLSKKSTTIWKAARENILGPACPTDLSEPRWANLLYGGSNCEVCGAKGIQRVDFALRRRACTSCMKENLVYSGRFKLKFPDLDPNIMDLIPYTNVGGWSHGHASPNSRFYWQSDVYAMSQKLGMYQKDVHMRKPGAKQALADFKEFRAEFVEAVVQHAAVCTQWAFLTADQRLEEIKQRKLIRFNAIKTRLLSLGYRDVDIEQGICHTREVDSQAEVTDRSWKRIQAILEPKVISCKQRRLKIEYVALVKVRSGIVDDLYRGYKRTLTPIQWGCLPSTRQVFKFPGFKELVFAEANTDVTAASFDVAMESLPGLISSWVEDNKQELVQLLPLTATIGTDPLPVVGSSNGIERLELATSVFLCGLSYCPWELRTRGASIISWSEAVAHRCKHLASAQDLSNANFSFSKIGSDTAAHLLLLSGLSVSNTTPAAMDALDLRFVCLNCRPQTFNSVYGLRTLTWRACIAHQMFNHSSSAVKWQLLEPEAAATIRASGAVNPAFESRAWTCNHCSTYLDNWGKRSEVIQHLANTHAIMTPKDPTDFFYYWPINRDFPPTLVFPMPRPVATQVPKPGFIYQCKQCPAARIRLFDDLGVQMHLRDKHQIAQPVNGVDWAEKKA